MTKNQATVVIVLLVCLLAVTMVHIALDLVIAVRPFFAGGVAAEDFARGVAAEEPKLSATFEAPDSVTVGEEFDLLVETKNLHDKPITLDSIDVEARFLIGFEIVSISPRAVQNPDFVAYQKWMLSQQVAPGESLTVTMRLRAMRKGQFGGDIDVCNPNLDYVTLHPIIRVEEPPPSD